MVKSEFYVSHTNQTLGPFSESDIRDQMQQSKLALTDYLWLPDQGQWQMLALHFITDYPAPTTPPEEVELSASDSALEAMTDSKAATSKPSDTAKSVPTDPLDLKKYDKLAFNQELGISNEQIWFVYRDKAKYGPYRFLEVVHLLQEQRIDHADFIWKPGMHDWEQARDVAEYSRDILEQLSEKETFHDVDMRTVFIQRAFPRVPYDSEVILHDDQQLIIGTATTLSEGGAFVAVPNPVHKRGDRLKLHFSAAGVPVPFNCVAEVTQVYRTEPTGYCLKFTYLGQDDQRRIQEFAEKEVRRPMAKA